MQNNIHPDNNASEQSQQEQDKSSQISLPKNEESRGPFEHSGETARQTEEQQVEEKEEKP